MPKTSNDRPISHLSGDMSKHLPRFEIMSVYEDNNKRSRLLFIPRLLMADSCESGGSEGGAYPQDEGSAFLRNSPLP